MRYHKSNGDELIVYTEEERERALQVSLTSLASSLGYSPIRQGAHYSLKEMDSLIIYNDRSWNRWSGKGTINSGSQIDFLLEFGGISSVPEAIQYLLEFSGERIQDVYVEPAKEKKEKREFKLPEKNDNYRRLYAYLMQTRGLSQEVVSFFVHEKLIYEDAAHHNIVYCGRDPEGNIRYAGLRGTADKYGKTFKMDVPGNDKNYGVNIVNKKSNVLKVYEAVIDCMSYIDLFGDKESNKLILGMVEDNPLQQFLKDYDHIEEIAFCLDSDEAAEKALYGDLSKPEEKRKPGLIEKYRNLGYKVRVERVPFGKDFNACLLEMKENPEKKEQFECFLRQNQPVSAEQIKEALEIFAQNGYMLYESEDNIVNPCFLNMNTYSITGYDGWNLALEDVENLKAQKDQVQTEEISRPRKGR